jgi:hypothetical protein
MKILHAVESYFPSVSGAPEVVRHLSERMVKAGHDETDNLCTQCEGSRIENDQTGGCKEASMPLPF